MHDGMSTARQAAEQRLSIREGAVAMQDDAPAVVGEGRCNGASDALGCARDENCLALFSHGQSDFDE